MSSQTTDKDTRKRVAVMQPYFFPYAGYFRLFAQTDEFILFDCVQFPRRGRVHRCEVPGQQGKPQWLTLPLLPQPQNTLIRDLQFAANARQAFDTRLARLPWVQRANGPNASRVREYLGAPLGSVVDYLEDGLRLVLDLLGLQARIRRSSQLSIAPDLCGQDRILALCHAAGATCYLNSPGGRDLYDVQKFAEHGIELDFLPEYRGPHMHLLPALMTLPAGDMRNDILGQTPAR